MSRPTPKLAIYNPSQLSKQAVIDQFVVRRALLDRLLDDLHGARPGDSNQHHLLVGPRGMGKTMFLYRLRYAVEDDPDLSQHWLPLTFPEEQYNVARLSDLWVNCLDALGDAMEAQGRAAEVKALDELVKELPPDNEERRARAALAALDRWSEQNGVGLLLLIDNLDMILDTLDNDEQWTLRKVMSAGHRLLFVGASSRGIEVTYNYGKAFYDFFQVHLLRGLDEPEARSLLVTLADLGETPHVSELLEQDPARFKTLHVLTGGNLRTLVIVYEILVHNEGSDVGVDLERVLDQHTPLYKARLEEMPSQSRQVVDALAQHWDPMTAAALASEVRLEVKHVSSLLNRLVQQQVVEQVAYPPGRKRAYQIAERFFNIWYLMRSSRRARTRLLWLVKFLKLFYGPTRVHDQASLLLGNPILDQSGPLEAAEILAIPSMKLAPTNELAATLQMGGPWPEVAGRLHRVLAERDFAFHERTGPLIMARLEAASRTGHAADAVKLLDETGNGERWRPLREALNAVAENAPDSLQRLAPEVREPAQEIFRRLTEQRQEAAPPKPPKRQSRRVP